MTKSPRAVAREALRLAQESLPAYSSKFSRQDFGLAEAPHYSTLCYAARRLLKKGTSSCSSSRPPRAPGKAA